MVADISPLLTACLFETDEHGFSVCTATVQMDLYSAFGLYDSTGVLWLHATEFGDRVWSGRLQGREIVPGGIRLQAAGAWVYLLDAPYTEMWTNSSYRDWEIMPVTDGVDRWPQRFEADNNNRLFAAARTGETYGNSAPGSKALIWGLPLPAGSSRKFVRAAFDYRIEGIDTNWVFGFQRRDASGAFLGNILLVASIAGVVGPTSYSATFTACDRVAFFLQRSAADAVYTSATGSTNARLTGLRVMTTTSPALYSDEILRDLVAFVSTVNPLGISSATNQIQSPGLDLANEEYADALPGTIVDRLAKLGDSQTPPRLWRAAIWEDNVLRFEPRSADRTWFVDVADVSVSRALDRTVTSVYGVYQDANAITQRTAVVSDAAAIATLGIDRRDHVSVRTTSSAEAAVAANALLADQSTLDARGQVVVRSISDEYGATYPLHYVRAGHDVVIRNLPPSLSTDVDRIRRFRISRTIYDPIADLVTIVPENATELLDVAMLRATLG